MRRYTTVPECNGMQRYATVPVCDGTQEYQYLTICNGMQRYQYATVRNSTSMQGYTTACNGTQRHATACNGTQRSLTCFHWAHRIKPKMHLFVTPPPQRDKSAKGGRLFCNTERHYLYDEIGAMVRVSFSKKISVHAYDDPEGPPIPRAPRWWRLVQTFPVLPSDPPWPLGVRRWRVLRCPKEGCMPE